VRLLLIGGSGVLGTEVQRQLQVPRPTILVDAPSHKELDICNLKAIIPYIQKRYDKIILLAGEKNQTVIELDSYRALRTNIQGISNVVEALQISSSPTQLVYISTGYVYKGNSRYHKENDGVFPCNKYAWSKLGGECAVRMLDEKQYLIIRCEFSKQPWHRDWAYTDQYTSREEIEVATYKICKLLRKEANGTYNVGGKRKSVYQYAKSLNKDRKIFKCKMKDFAAVLLPHDSSLDTSKYDKFMEGNNDKTS
jgi:dTDP-4-dehydrorhamnose reductase